MHSTLAAILIELRTWLNQFYGERLSHVILYGSQARGDAAPDSDIDVLVVLTGSVDAYNEIDRTSAYIADLSLRYGTVIACSFVAQQHYSTVRSPFILNVQREGVPV